MARLKAELGVLEASVERAGAALACPYSCSEEFEAAVIRARRGRVALGHAAGLQLVLAATALAAVLGFVAVLF